MKLSTTLTLSLPGIALGNSFTDTFVREDKSIRIFGSDSETTCVYKRWGSYKAGDDLWLWPCEADHDNPSKAGKFHWSYDSGTGLVKSVGSESQGVPMCWTIQSNLRYYKQRVRINPCDSENVLQQFDYINGRIHSRMENRICAGFEDFVFAAAENAALTFQDCYPSTFGDGENFIGEDHTIKPFSWDDNSCAFKKYSGYNVNDEIWLSDCANLNSPNANKNGKFKWNFNKETGQVSSMGAEDQGMSLCWRISSSNRAYKQRVRLANCNENDVLQQFGYSDGRLHLKAAERLCLGFESAPYYNSGSTALIFSTCYPNGFGVVEEAEEYGSGEESGEESGSTEEFEEESGSTEASGEENGSAEESGEESGSVEGSAEESGEESGSAGESGSGIEEHSGSDENESGSGSGNDDTENTTQDTITTTQTGPTNCNNRIIGGQAITDGQPPFQADWILNLNMGCGASWIDQEHILTAAHCFGNQPSANQQFSVSMKTEDGSRQLLANFDGSCVTIHPQYNENTVVNDIAIIRLCGFSGEHAVVGLPEAGQHTDFDYYWVYGWGNRNPDYGGDYPDILHWVQTPTVDFQTCHSNYGLSSYQPSWVICAGQAGIDSCQGDSGGPLVQYGDDCNAVQWGVVSRVWQRGGYHPVVPRVVPPEQLKKCFFGRIN